MPIEQTPVAISGIARVGKDAFCQFLCEQLNAQGISAKRFALADELKNRIQEPLRELSGIDVWKCSPKEKELVRDYLVSVGKIKRYQSEGQYWTSLLEKQIRASDVTVPVITDVRYDVFPYDEIWWAQNQMQGVLVHLSRYEVIKEEDLWDYHHDPSVIQDSETKEWRKFVAPPNKDETENDPKLRAKADYVLAWPTAPDLSLLREHCAPYIEQFIAFLKETHLRS